MSYGIFKQNMLSYMQNQQGIDSYESFAKRLTMEYDLLIRRGFQTVNNVPIQKPNKELMEQLVSLALLKALQQREGLHDVINDIGKGIVGYWTGATLSQVPPPVIPAIGAIQNITTTSAVVTNPGKFPDVGPSIPTNNSETFLNQLINGIKIHLLSIEGIYNTISIYPGAPVVPPAPGFLQWRGFQIQEQRSVPQAQTPTPTPTPFTPPTVQDTQLSPEQVQAKREELQAAQRDIDDVNSPPEGRQTAREYSRLLESELQSNTINAAPVEITNSEIEELVEQVPESAACANGAEIVRIATQDIGVIEYGAPDGKNWGGGGPTSAVAGKIDEMMQITGLNNQEKVQRTGSGYYWCAAAVSLWWSKAGLPIPPGAASCDNWMNWGRQNGWFSQEPKIGAAVLYGTVSDANHIGIVSGILPDGRIVTIEGNTSGGGFNRNGVGVFTKTPSRGKIVGYVHPPQCD